MEAVFCASARRQQRQPNHHDNRRRQGTEGCGKPRREAQGELLRREIVQGKAAGNTSGSNAGIVPPTESAQRDQTFELEQGERKRRKRTLILIQVER